MNLKLYLLMAQQSFKTFSTYRFTSALVVIFGFMFTLIEVVAGRIYYSFDKSIGGFSYDQYQVMIMSIAVITYTYNLFFIGAHETLADDIIEGNLDYTFLRPVNSYFFYALKELDFPSAINLIVYIPITIYLLLEFHLNFINWLAVISFYIVGVIFIFAMNQIVVEISFWKDNLIALNGIPEHLVDAANRPARIYPKLLRMILINVIPVLSLSNGIVNITFQRNQLIGFIQLFMPLVVVTAILLFISYLMWKRGIHHYCSAS